MVGSKSGVKNFKKFRKVQNITAGIPRMVAVVEHVPRANKQLLQDWSVETSATEPAETEDVESSQDIFRFQPGKRGRTNTQTQSYPSSSHFIQQCCTCTH